ncbi:uncharacterized protein MELLADRAFT_60278 [Melampsora larici-populina 98AG31]|uniref:Uncharacterized protein n=1 Tax=Melampsora larici-populina (strain 98AG31 / pathotype 3-4-7) TaxID=747676 RepID=F4RAR4_MELLP|nr:uncharacterized protein MELLADRAFT_60278 [Melampsora larici-populina 98AG31]EGG10736.1 hypothetical protein MELLADRAFT_60278 [Melampsora larici-populina 98AG31]
MLFLVYKLLHKVYCSGGETRSEPLHLLQIMTHHMYQGKTGCATTKTIQDLQSQPSQPVHFGIQKLAEKVLVLVNTLDNQHVPQTDWLKKHEHLVKECQDLAQEALLNPQYLKDLERLWATGIWVALEIGKWGRTDNIPMPDGLRNQVKLEIQAAWHYGAQFTEAFDHWMRKEIPTRGHDHGLEECLKRAELIGQHEKEDGYQIGRIRHPTDRMVAEYLSGHTLPREAVLVQGLLAEFQEIFQEPHVEFTEGQYAIDILAHMLHFWSYDRPRLAFGIFLNNVVLCKNMNSFQAKRDILQHSEKLRPFLTNIKLNSRSQDLYSILSNPLEQHQNVKNAINRLLIEMKNIPEADLQDSYKLIMAHNELGKYVEQELLSEAPSTNRWDIFDGIQRAWSKIYPGFRLGREDLMAYNYGLVLEHPHLLAHAKWDNFMQVTQLFKEDVPSKPFWNKPSQPYQVAAYDGGYYRNIAAGMSNKEIPYPLGLEMLMHLTNYLPQGPDHLLQLISKESAAIRDAIRHVMSKEFKWPSWTNHDRSEQEMKEIKHFVKVLDKITPVSSMTEIAKVNLVHAKDNVKLHASNFKCRIMHQPLDTPTASDGLELLNGDTSSLTMEQWRQIFQKTSPVTTQIAQTTLSWYPRWEASWNLSG